MKCQKCGTNNEANASFCRNCGSTLRSETNEIRTNSLDNEPKVAIRKPFSIKWIFGICVVFIIFGVIAATVSNAAKKIDLNDYLTITVEGYNGYGVATANIDWTALEKEYGRSISFKNNTEAITDASTPINFLKDRVNVDTIDSENLSNGDEVVYQWKIDGSVEKIIDYKIESENGSYKVEGLPTVEEIDVFSNLYVEFSGIEPNGKVSYTYEGEGLNTNNFICNQKSGLSIGDKIIISLDNDSMDYYVDKIGGIPKEYEKEYMVESLVKYMDKIEDLDSETLGAMQNQAYDEFQSYSAKKWNSEDTELMSFDYIGNYLLNAKEINSYGKNNLLYLVYRVKVHNSYAKDEVVYDQTNEYYWFIQYSNILKNTDNKVQVDVMSYSTPSNIVEIEVKKDPTSNSVVKRWQFKGYDSVSSLYSDIIASNLDKYNFIENIDENR